MKSYHFDFLILLIAGLHAIYDFIFGAHPISHMYLNGVLGGYALRFIIHWFMEDGKFKNACK